MLRDAYHAYVKTLARVEPQAPTADLDTIMQAIDDAEVDASVVFNGVSAMDEVIEKYTTKRFSLLRWMHLLPANFDNTQELTAYVMQRLEEDLRDAEQGQDSPVRAALWSLAFPASLPRCWGRKGDTPWNRGTTCLIRPLRWRNWRAPAHQSSARVSSWRSWKQAS